MNCIEYTIEHAQQNERGWWRIEEELGTKDHSKKDLFKSEGTVCEM